MKTYWIKKQEFNSKIDGKMGTGQTAEVLLMDEEDKQWLKAEVRAGDKATDGAILKVLADYGKPTDEEYRIEVLKTDSPEED